jgi:hypothetical protein
MKNTTSKTVANPPIEQLDDAPSPESIAVHNLKNALRLVAEHLAESNAREARMASDIRALQASNWRLVAEKAANAERDKPVEIWMCLRAAARDVGQPDQNVRALCNLGIIVCEKRGGRWFCEMNSLRAQISMQRPGGHTKTAGQVAADQFKRVRFP